MLNVKRCLNDAAGGTGADSAGILCDLSPYMLYSVPYSCGPDINVCCQFDFWKKKCWRRGDYQEPVGVTEENVAQM